MRFRYEVLRSSQLSFPFQSCAGGGLFSAGKEVKVVGFEVPRAGGRVSGPVSRSPMFEKLDMCHPVFIG